MKAALAVLGLGLALASPAAAHEPVDISGDFDGRYLWLDAPNTTDVGSARIRIVFAGNEGAAVLTPNQYWVYSEAYRRHLARLSQRQTVHTAIPRARVAAFRDVTRQFANLRVDGIDLDRTYGETIIPGL